MEEIFEREIQTAPSAEELFEQSRELLDHGDVAGAFEIRRKLVEMGREDLFLKYTDAENQQFKEYIGEREPSPALKRLEAREKAKEQEKNKEKDERDDPNIYPVLR